MTCINNKENYLRAFQIRTKSYWDYESEICLK